MTITMPAGTETSVPAAVLEIHDLTVHHGQLRALTDVSLTVPRGEVTAIIGANGAGKSTLLRTIAGLHRPTSGAILLDGRDITAEQPHRRVAAGIALVPEGRRLFPSLSVEENLRVGATGARRRDGEEAWNLDRVYELFGWMKVRRRQHAYQLSGGEQQAVAIGRALMSNPRVLLLDELSLGLSPKVVRQMYGLMPQLLQAGVTVLLVEQDVSQAVRVAAHIQCLLEGHCVLEGRPDEFTAQEIEAAYFGLGSRAEAVAAEAAAAEMAAGEAAPTGSGVQAGTDRKPDQAASDEPSYPPNSNAATVPAPPRPPAAPGSDGDRP